MVDSNDLTIYVCSECCCTYTETEIAKPNFIGCCGNLVPIGLRAVAENYPALYMRAVTSEMMILYT